MRNLPEKNDTICAIATPQGEGGIGIVRISGAAASAIAASLYRGAQPWHALKSRTAYFGEVFDPQDGSLIDEALFLLMAAPHSYTGEDVVEIQAHGNPLILKKILSVLVARGARLADPGEFTRRAFLSGRIDLAQAEAVMEMIASKSDAQHQWALGQLKGQLSGKVSTLKAALLSVLAQIEASIDFSEEELPLNSRDEISGRIQDVLQGVRALLSSYEMGRQIREGFTVVIAGRANVGKSSLMNYFLQEDRAIVTSIAGTTRDLLRESMNLDGLLVKLIDTAGFRETSHPIEQEGLLRAEAAQKDADLILWVLDASQRLKEDDYHLLQAFRNRSVMILLNKCDLPVEIEKEVLKDKYSNTVFIDMSIKSGKGLEDLRSEIKSSLIRCPEKEPVMVGLLRHRKALEAAEAGICSAAAAVESALSWEFPAIDLRESIDALGQITGEATVDALLDEIFGQFCIGK